MNSILLSALIVLVFLQSSMAWYVSVADKTFPRTRLSSFMRPGSATVFTTASSPGYCVTGSCDSSNVFPTFRDFFRDVENAVDQSKSYPRRLPLDVKETTESYEVTADVPGVQKEDVKLMVKDGVLTITSERKAPAKQETDKVRREERFVGTSQRSLSLPENADEDNIKARYDNGVLHVIIPKLPESPKNVPRTIEIQ
jgi:HSP20 family protein